MAVRRRSGRVFLALFFILLAIAAVASVAAPRAHAQAAVTAPAPVGDPWSADAWAAREKALDTDAQAVQFAHDLGHAYQASIRLPAPGFFIETVRLNSVTRLRGSDGRSVWTATYDVVIRSVDVTGFATTYSQVTRFGPGLHPGDINPPGLDDVFAFADMQPFPAAQRIGMLNYLVAKKCPRIVEIARLDQPFPGAPWYEDTPMRADFLARGKAHGMTADELAYCIYASGKAELVGFDPATGSWVSLGK